MSAHPYRTAALGYMRMHSTRRSLDWFVAAILSMASTFVLVGLLTLSLGLSGCAGAQKPSADVVALATIHAAGHTLVLIDDSAAAYYRSRADDVGQHGCGGGGCRGQAYLDAMAPLDRSYDALERGMDLARDSLVSAEHAARDAKALSNAAAQCRAGMAVRDASEAMKDVAVLLHDIGVSIDAQALSQANALVMAAAGFLPSCSDGGAR